MSDWYARQFGDTSSFALTFSFGRPSHKGSPTEDATWGGIGIWSRERCLTRSLSADGGVANEVRWSLAGILEWLCNSAHSLANEEPFPAPSRDDAVRDACDWINSTERPPLTLSEAEEDAWFLQRSEWRGRHSVRRAVEGVALPNVAFRRLGDFIEVSWDNDSWAAPRGDLRFLEQRGTDLVAARSFASVLTAALSDVLRALSERYPEDDRIAELKRRAADCLGRTPDWRWLLHRQTADTITASCPDIEQRLRGHAENQASGLYLPHSPETLLLRSARLVSPEAIRELLGLSTLVPTGAMSLELQQLARPSQPRGSRPWLEGYSAALSVRETLNWGLGPAPNLQQWLEANHVAALTRSFFSSIDLVTIKSNHSAGVVVNTASHSHLRREIAFGTALGHLLLDPDPTAVDGAWEHWPSAARARAFAAMLHLPEDGVRDVLGAREAEDVAAVRRVMTHFHTGPYATAYHLRNLRLIRSDELRDEIIQALVA